MPGQKEAAPALSEQERRKWRRFELITEDRALAEELDAILDRTRLTRRELAVILLSLRVRPEFSLEDFKERGGPCG